jgi:rubrerythrin
MDTQKVERQRNMTRGSTGMDVERVAGGREAPADYVPFALAGDSARGEYHCSECGYGVTVYRELPRCPMCSNEQWEPSTWSPFARARNVLQ